MRGLLKTLAAALLLGGSAMATTANDGYYRFLGKPGQGMQDVLMEQLKKRSTLVLNS